VTVIFTSFEDLIVRSNWNH